MLFGGVLLVKWGMFDGFEVLVVSEENNVSNISAKNNINIIADNITNRSSIITAGNQIDIKAYDFKNTKTTFQVQNSYTYETHWKRCKIWGCSDKRARRTRRVNNILASNTGAILSANSISIEAINSVKLDNPTLSAVIPTPSRSSASDPIIPTTSTPNTNSSGTTSTIHIEIPAAGDRLFIKASPDSEYLIETSPFLNDPSMLTGSRYCYAPQFSI